MSKQQRVHARLHEYIPRVRQVCCKRAFAFDPRPRLHHRLLTLCPPALGRAT